MVCRMVSRIGNGVSKRRKVSDKIEDMIGSKEGSLIRCSS
jgi:hypothetical protein